MFFINDMGNGGAERVVSSLLTKNDILIQIWKTKFYEFECYEHYILLNKKGFLPFDLIMATIKLYIFVKRNKISSINSHLFWANYINSFVSIYTAHESICTHCVSFSSKFKKGSLSRLLHSILMKWLVTKANTNTFKSRDMMKDYMSHFDLMKTKVIYNPIDLIKAGNKSQLIDVNKFKFKSERIYLLFVGRFHETKKSNSIITSFTTSG